MSGSFWRTGVLHPLSVHFPIALLLVSTITMLISFFIQGDRRKHRRNAARWLLFAGCITAWVSVYTGNLADGIVARKICNPGKLALIDAKGNEAASWSFKKLLDHWIRKHTNAC